MTKRESPERTLQQLAEKLDQLCAGASPEDVIDNAFVDALVEWLGPSQPLTDEFTQYATTRLQAVMKDDAAVKSTRLGDSRGAVMRIVHTSDWHAGRVWKGRDRLPELQDILEHLAQFVERER